VHPFPSSPSIRRRLPLLISALLLAVVGAFSWAAYRVVERALTIAATEQARGASARLATLLDESVRRMRADVRRVALDSAVQRYFERPDPATQAAARRALEQVKVANGQLVGIELLDARGMLLIGTTARSTAPGAVVRKDRAAIDSTLVAGGIGPFVARGDSAHYEVILPVVRSGGDTVGYVVQLRRLVSTGSSAQTIGQLIGAQATLLFGNASGDLWTDLQRIVPGPPVKLGQQGALSWVDSSGTPRLGAVAGVSRSPWMVWVSLPRSAILAPARELLGSLALIALVIVAAGALGAWVLSRQITNPLTAVASAAEGIAAGDYSRRVPMSRADELGKLATSFNSMAQQVEEGHAALETRVAERTRDLEEALRELGAMQGELVRREKLAILGQLAGGVGHELRNPLGVMTNALYYLEAVLTDATPGVKDYLGILKTQVTLSEKIIGDLLDFARVKPPRRETVRAHQLVDDQLARAGSTEGITIEHDFPPGLPPVDVDPVQIGQVLLNLITNAIQAMGDKGGTLSLRAALEGAGQLRLDVADTGGGIAPENAAHIFEPLFTTKARGIGLGLAVSRTLMQSNGGDITFTSTPGAGTTFSIRLPVSAKAA
jgi:C4-dicarboxylate-specific signal transduction histidine kinase